MSAKFRIAGSPIQQGGISLHEERRGVQMRGARRYRLLINGAVILLNPDQLFDLAEVVDEMCDIVEEEEEQNVG